LSYAKDTGRVFLAHSPLQIQSVLYNCKTFHAQTLNSCSFASHITKGGSVTAMPVTNDLPWMA